MGNNRRSNPQGKTARLLWLLIGIIVLAVSVWFALNTLDSIWWESISRSAGGVIIGALIGALGSLLGYILRPLTEVLREKIQEFPSRLAAKIAIVSEFIRERIHAFSNTLLEAVGTQAAGILVAISSAAFAIASYVSGFLGEICAIPLNLLASTASKFSAPKWYHHEGAIDPGLIEVSLAVTTVLIALPSFVNPNIPVDQANFIKAFRFLGELIPTFTSISLLDRYAKSKGAKSVHILFSPIQDGPFFLLGWSIVIGFVVIAVITFPVS